MTTLTTNAQRLLRALVVDGPAYRADLARSLDVSRATITNLVQRLSADGWIEDIDPDTGSLKNLIGTTPRLGTLASVIFLVDTCGVTLSTLDGRVLRECTLTTPLETPAADRLAAAADLVDRLRAEIQSAPLTALHLAVDTQMDAVTGDIYAQRASSRWFGVNPKRFFSSRFEVPVHVQNTARLEGLAEYLWGAGRTRRELLYVDASYGITSGHIVGGIIQSGARGGSGELGHTIYNWNGPLCSCGNPGCLMQYVSIPALLRDQQTATGVAMEWPQFSEAVHAGDPTCVGVAKQAATVLGRALVSTCHVVDPELVVLSGAMVRSLPGFVEDVARVVREHALPLVGRSLRIVAAELDDAHTATARAGIASLRREEDVITAASII